VVVWCEMEYNKLNDQEDIGGRSIGRISALINRGDVCSVGDLLILFEGYLCIFVQDVTIFDFFFLYRVQDKE